MFPNIHDSEIKADVIILVMRVIKLRLRLEHWHSRDCSNSMPDAIIRSRLHLVDFVLDHWTNASQIRTIGDNGLFVCAMTLLNATTVHDRISTFLQWVC
jgi:hypothetical protein